MVDKDVKINVNPLEQFILLAKGARGAAIISLINQVLETNGIYVFGELLQLPSIQEVIEYERFPCYVSREAFKFGYF
jgi:COP9 signalosome complex subunit 7